MTNRDEIEKSLGKDIIAGYDETEYIDKLLKDTDNDITSSLEEYSADMEKFTKYNYSLPRSEKDKDYFTMLVNDLSKLSESSSENFKELILKEEKDISNKTGVVQRLIISTVLITYLYKLKGLVPTINVMQSIMLIPYYAENDEWYKIVRDHLLPLLVNNKFL